MYKAALPAILQQIVPKLTDSVHYRLAAEAYAALDAEVASSCESLQLAVRRLEVLFDVFSDELGGSQTSNPVLLSSPSTLSATSQGKASNQRPQRRHSLSPKVLNMLTDGHSQKLQPALHGRRGSLSALHMAQEQGSLSHATAQLDATIIRAAMLSMFQHALECLSMAAAQHIISLSQHAAAQMGASGRSLLSSVVWFDALQSNAIKTLQQHGHEVNEEAASPADAISRLKQLRGKHEQPQVLQALSERLEQAEKRKVVAESVLSKPPYNDLLFDAHTLVESSKQQLGVLIIDVQNLLSAQFEFFGSGVNALQALSSNAVQKTAAATQAIRGDLQSKQKQTEEQLKAVHADLDQAKKWKADHESALERLEELTSSLETCHTALMGEQEEVASLQTRLLRAEQDMESMKTSADNTKEMLEAEIIALNKRYEGDSHALTQELNAERQEFRAAKTKAEQEVQKLQDDKASLKSQLEATNKSLSASTNETQELKLQLQQLQASSQLAQVGQALLAEDSELPARIVSDAREDARTISQAISPGLREKISSLSPTKSVLGSRGNSPDITKMLNRSIVAELARVRAIKAQERVDKTAAGLKVFVHQAQEHVLQAAATEQSIASMRSDLQSVEYMLDTKQSQLSLSAHKLQDLQKRLLLQHKELCEFQQIVIERAAGVSAAAQALAERDSHLARKSDALQSLEEQLNKKADEVSQQAAQAQYLGKLKLNLQASTAQSVTSPAAPVSSEVSVEAEMRSHVSLSSLSSASTSPTFSSPQEPRQPASATRLEPQAASSAAMKPQTHAKAGNAQTEGAKTGWSKARSSMRKGFAAVQVVTRVQTLAKSPTRSAPPPPLSVESGSQSPLPKTEVPGSASPVLSGATRRWSRLRRSNSAFFPSSASASQSPIYRQASAGGLAGFRANSMREVAAALKASQR